jgi:hypothetical protein
MALWKNVDTQLGKPKHLQLGQIDGLTITGAMSGYVDGASLTISAPGGSGVQAVGTIQVTGGVITGYTLSNPGAGYTTAPTVTAPTGTGATIVAKISKNRPGLSDNADIVFVSREESLLDVNRAKGIKGPGWYKITERQQADNSLPLRFMTEQLVFLDVVNATSGDNTDDVVVGDNALVIGTQPANSSVTAPAAASFTVVATGTTPTYQWQLRTGGLGSYANVSNGGVYTNATTATLNISNSTGLNGNVYRCVVTNSGGTAVVKSKGALLTVA